MLSTLWAAFKEAFLTPARIVPFVMTVSYALLGAAAAWVAVHFPGLPTFTPAEIWGVFGASLLGGVAHALHWQQGWQDFEKRHDTPPPE